MEFFKNTLLQYLATGSLINWFILLHENNFRINSKYYLKALYITMLNMIIYPMGILEKIMFYRRIKSTKVESPVFVIGHWRSGTTYLVNLMSRDLNFGFFNILHIYAPTIFLTCNSILRWCIRRIMPNTRPMDNVKMDIDLPQEEEFAIANLCSYSICHITVFPQHRNKYIKYGTFDEIPQKTIDKWKKIYVHMLKKVTFQNGGKRLLLKSPTNTCKIKELLELFPDAKFIHIYRNPYKVFASTVGMYKKLFPIYSLQEPISDDEAKNFQLDVYEKFYKKYLNDKKLIPEGNLIEIRYEDFVKEPLDYMKKIYKELNIPDFQKSKKNFELYIQSQKNYKTNSHDLKDISSDEIYEKIKFTAQKWGYESN